MRDSRLTPFSRKSSLSVGSHNPRGVVRVIAEHAPLYERLGGPMAQNTLTNALAYYPAEPMTVNVAAAQGAVKGGDGRIE
jgi:hypothetical protein